MESPKIDLSVAPPDEPVKIESVEIQTPYLKSKKERRKNEHVMIIIAGLIGVFAWIILFTLGMLIDSSQYRSTINQEFTAFKFIMALITYMPSNIALLCLVASFTGGCASLLVIRKAQKGLGTEEVKTDNNTQIYMNESPFSSMMRGILVFFAFLGGIFITSSTVLSSPTEQSYTQAAGIVSMIAFLVGYDPTMFRTLVNLTEKLKGTKND